MKKKQREELRESGADALQTKEKELRDALWKLKLQKSTGQLENPARMKTVRREIARVRTYARQQSGGKA
jgi:large subunit ribosomal protein L29